jgi:hypothetical protein
MTKRSLLALVVAVLGGCTPYGQLPTKPQGDAMLTVRGGVKDGPYVLGRADLARLPRKTFRAIDPVAGREAVYEGVALAPVVMNLPLEPLVDTVVVLTGEKEAIPLPIGAIRQYGPILADRQDGAPLASLQLAWPNLDQLGLDRDPRATLWWARQVSTLELVAWGRTWARALRPPPGTTDAARRGAGQFALRCVACHRLVGYGGERGPDLTGAIQRLGDAGFRAALKRHPQWPDRVGLDLEPGDAVAAQIALFVATMEQMGPSTPDEAPVTRPHP